ncbi:uncharacterized protein TNCV_2745181 [Trichonephila clavipes]|nr:uncharacterized protein TNCV_2745181 [Trichonephila clavipes]
MGPLNVLKVSDIKGDQTQSINQSPIKLSAICMSPEELPYISILLDETFTKTLWDTGAEKSFISEETYQKYFFYKQVKKLSTQVITAQGAKRRNMGVVELNIRIRDFKKPWLFHVLGNLEYPCILGIDFIGGSKIFLDFDRKSLAIQDSQVEDIKVDEGNLLVDLLETKLNVVANVLDNNTVENIIGEKDLSERLGIRHVKTVVYRPQANRTECENRDLVQMIANYVNQQHDTWDQFLREFAYAIRTAVNETTKKTPAELFFGRNVITPFQKLVMVSDGMEFAVGDIERLFEVARRNTETKHEKWEKYYNGRRRDVQIKVRIYRHRKCDEMEIGTGSSDNGSLLDESSSFDRVQRRSNESREGKKKGSEVKRELEEKGLSFTNDQGEKHTNKTNKRGPLIRSIPSSWSESGGPETKVQKESEHRVNKRNFSSNDSNSVLPRLRKKNGRKETITPNTSGYNLRPRKGKREESQLTIERKTQQGGPVRSRKGRERNNSPYIEE